MKISFHQISLVVIAVATSFGYSASVSAQQLRAESIDEVVKALTLEEKCHLVLGRGMHFNDDAKFPGTAGSTFSVNRLGIPFCLARKFKFLAVERFAPGFERDTLDVAKAQGMESGCSGRINTVIAHHDVGAHLRGRKCQKAGRHVLGFVAVGQVHVGVGFYRAS